MSCEICQLSTKLDVVAGYGMAQCNWSAVYADQGQGCYRVLVCQGIPGFYIFFEIKCSESFLA